MELKVLNDNKNNLLSRREIEVSLSFENKTPSKEDVKNELSGKLNLNKDLVVVDVIKQVFGSRECVVKYNVYDTSEDLKRVERVKEKRVKEEEKAENKEIKKEEKKK